MISLELYVTILLIISAFSMYFIVGVLIKQLRLLKAPFVLDEQYDEHTRKILVRFRRVLFVISLTIIIMGMIPIAINILSLCINTGRPKMVSTISLVYSLGVHVQGLLLSYLVSRLYRLASNEKDMTDYTQQHLEHELEVEKSK
jgi:hypothetical protein